MKQIQVIHEKLETLINILLTNGVQPSELADNIFLKEYQSINISKIMGNIVLEMTFLDSADNEVHETKMKYYYDQNKAILKIEEMVQKKWHIIWERDSREAELINEIVQLIRDNFNNESASKFINTLPDSLKEKIKANYSKVA